MLAVALIGTRVTYNSDEYITTSRVFPDGFVNLRSPEGANPRSPISVHISKLFPIDIATRKV